MKPRDPAYSNAEPRDPAYSNAEPRSYPDVEAKTANADESKVAELKAAEIEASKPKGSVTKISGVIVEYVPGQKLVIRDIAPEADVVQRDEAMGLTSIKLTSDVQVLGDVKAGKTVTVHVQSSAEGAVVTHITPPKD